MPRTVGRSFQPRTMTPLMVNVGCGPIYHPAWLNLDVTPACPAVQYLDVRKGLPLGDGEADVCFSSHVIEHLTPRAAGEFLAEQERVLKPGGILRVVCPDLADICRTYLSEYDKSSAQGRTTFRHEHLVAELVDQLVRSRPGGELAGLWARMKLSDREWVAKRIGYVADAATQAGPAQRKSVISSLASRLATKQGRRLVADRLRGEVLCSVARLLGGRRLASTVRDGLFRGTGENHLWMWDEVTLAEKLRAHGFVDVARKPLGESDIPGWERYGLEIRNGVAIKPHSLVLEARKPVGSGSARPSGVGEAPSGTGL